LHILQPGPLALQLPGCDFFPQCPENSAPVTCHTRRIYYGFRQPANGMSVAETIAECVSSFGKPEANLGIPLIRIRR
jgi:hypothetical protein